MMGLIERAWKALGWGKVEAAPPEEPEVEADPATLAQAVVDRLWMTGEDGSKAKPEGPARAALLRAYRHCLTHAELRHMIRLTDAETRAFAGLPDPDPAIPREAYLLVTFTPELRPIYSGVAVASDRPELPTVADRRALAEEILSDRLQGFASALAIGRADGAKGQ